MNYDYFIIKNKIHLGLEYIMTIINILIILILIFNISYKFYKYFKDKDKLQPIQLILTILIILIIISLIIYFYIQKSEINKKISDKKCDQDTINYQNTKPTDCSNETEEKVKFIHDIYIVLSAILCVCSVVIYFNFYI